MIYRVKRLALLCLLIACTAVQASGSGGVNAARHRDKPTLVLVSIDGFRWDFQALHDTPTLDRIAANGLRAERMIPVFPTLTFPNHYSIATGLYPANHGLIGNRFPSPDRRRFYALSDREAVQDGSWYGGEPVWVAAEKAGMVTAAYFFIGTEADVGGVSMTYWNAYDESIPGEDRVDQVIDWLAMPDDRRPHFITLYFEDVDTMTHRHGPGSEQSIAAVGRVDGYLDRLLSRMEDLPVADNLYLVIVSDHGHVPFVEDEMPFIVGSVADIDDLRVVDHGASTYIYLPRTDRARAARIRDRINESWAHGTAMLAEETPDAWRVSSEAGFADVILVADPGYAALARPIERMSLKSTHGWAPEAPGMHAYFLASGPRLPKGETIGPSDAVDVYPLMMEILGLPITARIDGNSEKLVPLLRK